MSKAEEEDRAQWEAARLSLFASPSPSPALALAPALSPSPDSNSGHCPDLDLPLQLQQYQNKHQFYLIMDQILHGLMFIPPVK